MKNLFEEYFRAFGTRFEKFFREFTVFNYSSNYRVYIRENNTNGS